MTRRQRLENKGYKITVVINNSRYSGSYIARKNQAVFVGTSVTDLHKQIFGY